MKALYHQTQSGGPGPGCHRRSGGIPGVVAWLAVLWVSAACVEAADVLLAWDPPPVDPEGTLETSVAGYKVHYGSAPLAYSNHFDAGTATTFTAASLPDGAAVYFAVTAYNVLGDESDPSIELSVTTPQPVVLDHFAWITPAADRTSGVPFQVSVLARTSNDLDVAGFAGSVTLKAEIESVTTSGVGTASADSLMASAYDDARTEVIYLPGEVGRVGWITGLALHVSAPPGQVLRNWTLRMKTTALQRFTSKSMWESGGWATVFQGDLAVPAAGWVWFELSTPFYYDGLSNLMVDFSFNNADHVSQNGVCQATTVESTRRLYAQVNGGAYGDPLTWVNNKPARLLSATVPNVAFTIVGPATVTPAAVTGFSGGAWTGNVAVNGPAGRLTLLADDGSGHTGRSAVLGIAAGAGTVEAMGIGGAGGVLDSDSDGMVDTMELTAGTDPYNPASVMRMAAPRNPLTAEGSGIIVEWASVTGKWYTVQRSTNLASLPGFANIATNIPGMFPVTTYVDATATGSGPYYYRVQVQP